ncbi:hypothetical protein VW29_08380 [Devosia limi DSM 17137]|uniref:Uncharacterized protein n=1 Tax=Devosia limi DSM 17137 TaxID=1121477 RepID=A0A0F5LRB7_9HYPH|nr:hypothetical protein [Devosia limi]KKB84846.1 hypothetical protein VW29_08380 [Devosia limi DSM 17137]SHF08646.1 hypothetical protein SAMN02745223_01790 [Devosia limi DSM 17137]
MVYAIDPVSPGNANMGDLRSRHQTGDRALLPDSAPPAPSSPETGDNFPKRDGSRQEQERPAPPPPAPAGSMFAAAVIAGNLPPRPETLDELFLRIGNAPIPPESELRLRDLVV